MHGRIEKASSGINGIFDEDFRYKEIISAKPKNRWLELFIEYRKEILASWRPYVADGAGCVNRSNYRFEFSRLLGLHPYRDDLSRGHVLVVGDRTDIGEAVIDGLADVPIARVGCQDSFDWSSGDAGIAIAAVNISAAIFTCGRTFPRFATVGVAGEVAKTHSRYLRGFATAMKNKEVRRLLYVVEEGIDAVHASVLKDAGISSLVTGNLRGSRGLFGTAVRECAVAGKAVLEVEDGTTLTGLSASAIANLIVGKWLVEAEAPQQLWVKTESVPLVAAVREAAPRCSVEVRPFLHGTRGEKQDKGQPVDLVSSKAPASSFAEELKVPYVSLVVVGRNDDFSKNFTWRCQHFIDALGRNLERIPLARVELVFVDYAGPEDKAPMDEILVIPPYLKGRVRFIRVPVAVHERLLKKLNSTLPFFEYIAKNIGIRRAAGEFVLVTNADNVWSSALMELIAREDFNEGVLYRSVRWDTRDHTFDGNETVETLWNAMTTPSLLPSDRFDVKKRCDWGDNRFAVGDSLDRFRVQAWGCGAGDALMLSRGLWDAVKGFDEVPANPNVDVLLPARLMRMVPGSVRHFWRPINMHLRHQKVNVHRPAVSNHEEAMDQIACNGETTIFKNYDSVDWGLARDVFDEIAA